MKYQVVWGEQFEQKLADMWLISDDREMLRLASNQIDTILEGTPLRFGDPLESSVHRIAFIPPLGVEFEVIEDDKKVIVHDLWQVQ